MKIYVARHGQTEWNALNKTCGTTDIPLTELGLQQAEELADKVEDLGIDLIHQLAVNGYFAVRFDVIAEHA